MNTVEKNLVQRERAELIAVIKHMLFQDSRQQRYSTFLLALEKEKKDHE